MGYQELAAEHRLEATRRRQVEEERRDELKSRARRWSARKEECF
jgi:hypothetical protein